jgi:hypothetical protein
MNHNDKKLHVLGSLFFFGCFWLGFPLIAKAASNGWTVEVSAQRQDLFLNYPGSKLAPVFKVAIECSQRGSQFHYQNIFYSHCNAVGLRQYHALDITPGTAGLIRIKSVPDQIAEEGCAVANAVTRVYLHVYLKGAMLKYVAVPKESFDLIVHGLEHYGFRRFTPVPERPMAAAALLRVISEPAGHAENLSYEAYQGE